MKQNEDEWVEYRNVMDAVIERSGLHKSLFFDLRGNHDSFGVPVVGGSFDFFSKYSINGQLGRNGRINSVTLEVSLSHLFYSYKLTTILRNHGWIDIGPAWNHGSTLFLVWFTWNSSKNRLVASIFLWSIFNIYNK